MRLLVISILFAAFLSGCVSQYETDAQPLPTSSQPAVETQIPTSEQPKETIQEPSSETSYSGQVIAGATTKYIRFNKADYQKALNEGKVIYFYFYANWCPICREERPKILEAFNEMDYPDVVGFEVHFNDNEVTPDDEEISRQFGISYQHTTVIHVVGIDKTGKESFRSLSPVSKETIKEKIASLL